LDDNNNQNIYIIITLEVFTTVSNIP